jgi:hypothetical protein
MIFSGLLRPPSAPNNRVIAGKSQQGRKANPIVDQVVDPAEWLPLLIAGNAQ